MTLFELAVIFHKTGEIKPEVYSYQVDYIVQNAQEIYDDYIEQYKDTAQDERPDFQYHFARWMNDWLVDHGFGAEITDEEYDELVEEQEDRNLKEMLSVGENEDEEDQSH